MADSHSDDHPPFNHPAPIPLLIGVFLALVFLTILTLVTSKIELAQFAFAIAMIIATMKAALVCGIFMHMWWDKSFNVVFLRFHVGPRKFPPWRSPNSSGQRWMTG